MAFRFTGRSGRKRARASSASTIGYLPRPSEVLVQVEATGVGSFWATDAEGTLVYLSEKALQSLFATPIVVDMLAQGVMGKFLIRLLGVLTTRRRDKAGAFRQLPVMVTLIKGRQQFALREVARAPKQDIVERFNRDDLAGHGRYMPLREWNFNRFKSECPVGSIKVFAKIDPVEPGLGAAIDFVEAQSGIESQIFGHLFIGV